jgi:hypothetical protein
VSLVKAAPFRACSWIIALYPASDPSLGFPVLVGICYSRIYPDINLVVNLANMVIQTIMLKYSGGIEIIMIATMDSPVDLMDIEMAGQKRETLIDPLYKRIDKMGRVYVDRNLAESEVLIVVVKPKPEDKINYIKVGRS